MIKKFFVGLVALLMLLCCTACAQSESPVEAEETEAVIEPAAVPEATAELVETVVEEEEKALPTPPDVDISSWEFLYAGPHRGVGRYHPEIRTWEMQYMDSRCMDQTIAFMTAAREQGYSVWMNSAYRNWDYRLFWYEDAVYEYGSAYEATKHVFAAGCSDHHTGLGFCITDETYLHGDYNERFDEDIQDTEVYQWMLEHCAEYGFILRYPEGHEEHYIMACANAAHFRYVGVEAAEYIMENDICFEEFLELYK